jgi:hypothetical protein
MATSDELRAAIVAAVHVERLMERRQLKPRPRPLRVLCNHQGVRALREWVAVVGVDALAEESGLSRDMIESLTSYTRVIGSPPSRDTAARVERVTGIAAAVWETPAGIRRGRKTHRATSREAA